jgi:hypothetical protein
MEKGLLLAELLTLVNSVPDFARNTQLSRSHREWLGKAHALLLSHDRSAANAVRVASEFLDSSALRSGSVNTILNTLHRAIASLELDVGNLPGTAFGPGAVYDFMRSLRDLLQSVTTSVLIVDPYMNAEVFDSYVSAVPQRARTRLLLRGWDNAFKPALEAFVSQHQRIIEARTSSTLHDRVIFVDDRSCYVLGQSIKDAADSKPTYLAPLPSDVVALKLESYEAIWRAATGL